MPLFASSGRLCAFRMLAETMSVEADKLVAKLRETRRKLQR